MNMETLVALGTLSAVIMSIFLIGIYFDEIDRDTHSIDHITEHDKMER